MDTFFSNSSGTKRLKAVDTIVFMFLFPFIFNEAYEDVNYNSPMNIILRLMTEFNFYLTLFFCKDVPVEDIEKQKVNLIHLMKQIESISDTYTFLKECFSLPTHMMIHLFEKWKDMGSFVDNWCFKMERTCKKVKSCVIPGQHTLRTLCIRIPLIILSNFYIINKTDFSDDHMSSASHVGKLLKDGEEENKTIERKATGAFGISE